MLSVFDIDDLDFLRLNGLGLRHVDYKKGLLEQQEGSWRGDAVSLANYGLNEAYQSGIHKISREHCKNLQKEIEHFIYQSFQHFHDPFFRYADAAFHVLDRDDDARYPYDFDNYPLGKCGTKEFPASQIVFSIFTNTYQNEDIVHATMQVFLELKDKLRQLKIQKIQAWLQQAEQEEVENAAILIPLLTKILAVYSDNLFLEKPIFPPLATLFDQSSFSPEALKSLEIILAEVSNEKKGEMPLMYVYQDEQWHELDERSLKSKLIHYIKNQNLPNVKHCLSRLNPESYERLDWEECPLQIAASYRDTAILQAIYEFVPKRYDLLLNEPNLATPIYLAFTRERYDNVAYLLSQHPLSPADLTVLGQHILAGLPNQFSENYFKTLDSLLVLGDIGNEIEGLYKNPFAVCLRTSGYVDFETAAKYLPRFLPLADYRSKYLGLLSCSLELYYRRNDEPFRSTFSQLRQTILDSLTIDECHQINQLVRQKRYHGKAETTLYSDLSQSEEKDKFAICFAGYSLKSKNAQIKNSHRFWQPESLSSEKSPPNKEPCLIM